MFFFRTKLSGKNAVLYCCKNIPFNGLVIEGVVKIVMVSIGNCCLSMFATYFVYCIFWTIKRA